MAHDLRPFRDYDEKDVINLFAYNETSSNIESTPILKGTLVELSSYTDGASVAHVGWDVSQDLEMFEGAGANAVSNTVSQRHGVKARVKAVDTAGDMPLGMTLFDVREKDENGELLKFNPRKAAEMQAVLAGQVVPIVTKGIFLYEHGADPSIAGGALLYSNNAGEITDTSAGNANVCGIALGASKAVGSKWHTLIKLDCGLAGNQTQ
tara:strand:+ start:42181 stop:42804 length:624 start_codon:yes stop_codon:yes gene_type:complete